MASIEMSAEIVADIKTKSQERTVHKIVLD